MRLRVTRPRPCHPSRQHLTRRSDAPRNGQSILPRATAFRFTAGFPSLPDIRRMMEKVKPWRQRLLEEGTNIAVSSNGDFEIHTVVPLPGGLSLVLNDAYWGRLCISEVNQVIGAPGKSGFHTVLLLSRDPGETWRINGLPHEA